MASSQAAPKELPAFHTMRKDTWWIQPLAVFLGLAVFIAYATWAALQNAYYTSGPYLSPFYSPELFGDSVHALFGPKPAWWPALIPFSPAILILWGPGGFRFTCYYFRGAYYKGIWADPPACAVSEPRKGYRGERKFPLIFQNIHRYFLYLVFILIGFHLYDLWHSFWFETAGGGKEFGVGLGGVFLAVDVALLCCYVGGCHSFRHLTGGKLDIFSKSPLRTPVYDGASCLNRRHAFWGWASMYWISFCDLYIRLCAMGVWTDWRIF